MSPIASAHTSSCFVVGPSSTSDMLCGGADLRFESVVRELCDSTTTHPSELPATTRPQRILTDKRIPRRAGPGLRLATRIRAAPVDVHLRGPAAEEGVPRLPPAIPGAPSAAPGAALAAGGRGQRGEHAVQAALERGDGGADEAHAGLDDGQREGLARGPGGVVGLEEDAVERDGAEDAADAGAAGYVLAAGLAGMGERADVQEAQAEDGAQGDLGAP